MLDISSRLAKEENTPMMDYFLLHAHVLSNTNALRELFSTIREHYSTIEVSLFNDDSFFIDSIATLKDRVNAYLPNFTEDHTQVINRELEATFSSHPYAAICIIEALIDVPYMEYSLKRAFFMTLLHKGLEQADSTDFIDSVCKCIKLILRDGHLGTSEIVRSEISRAFRWLRSEAIPKTLEYRSYAACQLLFVLARSTPDIARIFFHVDFFLTHCIWTTFRHEKIIVRHAMSTTIEELVRQGILPPEKLRKTLPVIERNLRVYKDAATQHGSLLLLTTFVRYERNPEFYSRVMEIALDKEILHDLHCRLTIIRLIPLLPKMTNLFLSCHLNKTIRDIYFFFTAKSDQLTRSCAFISMAEFIGNVGKPAISPFLDVMMEKVISALDTKRVVDEDGQSTPRKKEHFSNAELFSSEGIIDKPTSYENSPTADTLKSPLLSQTKNMNHEMTPEGTSMYPMSPPSLDIDGVENDVVIEALKCLGAISKVCDRAWLQPHIVSLMDKLFVNGLNSYLAEALYIMGESVPEFIPLFQERLVASIAKTLMEGNVMLQKKNSGQSRFTPHDPDRSPQKKHQPIMGSTLTVSQVDESELSTEPNQSIFDPYNSHRSVEFHRTEEIIAMRTLATLNPLTNESIMTLVKTCVVPFLEHSRIEHRRVAVRTALRLMSTYIGEKTLTFEVEGDTTGEIPHTSEIVRDILEHIVDSGVSDIADSVRYEVFNGLDKKIDPYLASPDYLETLFMGLHDEKLYIREATLRVICRLAKIHPSYIISGLARIQQQFIIELQHSRNLAHVHHSARMLLQIVKSEIIIDPSSESHEQLQNLVLQKIQITDVSHLSTTLLNLLNGIVQNTQLAGHETTRTSEKAFPVLLSAIEDRNSCLQRRAALRALVSVIRSTTTVGRPFYQSYPEFLTILLSALHHGENTIDFETRKEIMRVLGVIGAVDPVFIRTFLRSRKEHIEEHTQSAVDAFIAQTEVSTRCSSSLSECYPAALLKFTTELLKNPNAALWTEVMRCMTNVLNHLTSAQLSPHLTSLLSVFLEILQNDECKIFHADIMAHLHELLVKGEECGQTQCNINALRIMRSIIAYCERTEADPEISHSAAVDLQTIILLEKIAKSFSNVVDPEAQRWIFKFLVQKMIDDHTDRKDISMKVISGLENFVSMLDRDIYFIVPLILHYIKPNAITANGININLHCLSFLAIAAQQHNFRDVSARTIHHLIRVLEHTTNDAIAEKTMDVLCEILVSLGNLGKKFLLLVDSYSCAKGISHPRFDRILSNYRQTKHIWEEKLVKNEPSEEVVPLVAAAPTSSIWAADVTGKATHDEIVEMLSKIGRVDPSVIEVVHAVQKREYTSIEFRLQGEADAVADVHSRLTDAQEADVPQITNLQRLTETATASETSSILAFFSSDAYENIGEGEWNRWMDDLSSELIRRSTEPAIRAIFDLAIQHPSLGREVLPFSFMSIFQFLKREDQQLIMEGLSKLLLHNTTKDVMMRIIRLAEFLEPYRMTKSLRREVPHSPETKFITRATLAEKFGIAYGENHVGADLPDGSFYRKHKFRVTRVAKHSPGAKSNVPVGAALIGIDDAEVRKISQIKECLDGKLSITLRFQRQPHISYAHNMNPYFDLYTLVHATRKANYLTKALHYTELVYEQMSDEQVFQDFYFVNLLVELYQQLNSPASAVGLLNRLFLSGKRLFQKDSYENFFVDKLAQGRGAGVIFEKLQMFPKAIESYSDQISEAKSKGMLPDMHAVLGLCKCFTSIGNWPNLVQVAKQNWTLCNESQKSELASESAAAAWYLEDWNHMEVATEALPSDQSDFFHAVLQIHKTNHEVAQKFINAARSRLDSNLSILVGESYHRAYHHISMLQHLSELEEVIIYQRNHERRPFLRNLWDKRFKSVAHLPKVLQVSLAIRSLVIPPEQDVQSWVKFIDITRTQDRPSMAEYGLCRLLKQTEYPASPASLSSQIDLQTCDILVTTEYLKNLKNDHGDIAMRMLNELIAVLPTRDDVGSRTKSACHFLLAQWYHSNVENTILVPSEVKLRREKVMENLDIARELDERNFQAWHSWAVMNLQAGLTCSERTGGSTEQVYFLQASLRGFLKSVCLSSAPSTGQGRWDDASGEGDGTSQQDAPVDTDFQDILQVLFIWFNYGHIESIRDEIEENIEDVRIELWLKVIPQLISRIDHKNMHVREQLHRLLTKIGLEHPHALSYSLIVCATSNEESPRKSAAASILDAIHKVRPAVMDEIALLSNELVRVAMGWCDKWMKALDMLLSQSYYETNSLEFFKYYLGPLYAVLDNPETTEERRFVDMLSATLKHAWSSIQKAFQDGANDRDLVQEALETYRRAHRQMSDCVRNRPKTVPLKDLSPILAERSFSIPMPGSYRNILDNDRTDLYFTSFLPEVRIIQSKQRPHRIALRSADGKVYKFLLKANEDLRTDERVMQLFSLINTFFLHSPVAPQTHNSIDPIMTYSVVPLSQDVGLIQWIENTETIYQMITKHRSARGSSTFSELNMIMQMGNLRNINEYANLPMKQRQNLLQYVIDNTPDDDLKHIFWERNATSEEWFDYRTNFVRSTATMSMVGYLLGLGDRHLNNIMLNDKGRTVHIDFGDCFEVAMLRDWCPEKVPFRLTRMLVAAMECCGVNGLFQKICENVMRVLRKNKDTIITLLETFAYDPLINWRLEVSQEAAECYSTPYAYCHETDPAEHMKTPQALGKTASMASFHPVVSNAAEAIHPDEEVEAYFSRQQSGLSNPRASQGIVHEYEPTREELSHHLSCTISPNFHRSTGNLGQHTDTRKLNQGSAEQNHQHINKTAKAALQRIRSKLTGTDFPTGNFSKKVNDLESAIENFKFSPESEDYESIIHYDAHVKQRTSKDLLHLPTSTLQTHSMPIFLCTSQLDEGKPGFHPNNPYGPWTVQKEETQFFSTSFRDQEDSEDSFQITNDVSGGHSIKKFELNPATRRTVVEQVQLLILESTSINNLCEAYIGWCPFW
ncbi:phosphatidylinositol 4-kinase [Perkinsela sp. CCAP 1560/4]|nr:phosphatidylinositol 4-kinase [Perkinsela sp. CCAP 1560/4]|eukprot:KNH07705.1 phosphatidylinositol 4-kinase [Perkinsela sp. CCAP 1560/4]